MAVELGRWRWQEDDDGGSMARSSYIWGLILALHRSRA
jgi:hypothetical protein